VKTLVLDLDDLLVHKEWTRQKGWTIYRRPGVQDFILEMGQYYEIVVFTDEPNSYADPIINRLDTHKVIPYRLYRPETQYHKGKHVRDLSKLNRDIGQVCACACACACMFRIYGECVFWWIARLPAPPRPALPCPAQYFNT
jgi:import inner membrane translocase subunit TIM50